LPLAFIAAALLAIAAKGPGSRVLAAGLPSAALLALAVIGERPLPARAPIRRGLIRLGDASYSIYVAQLFPLAACGIVLPLLLPAHRLHPARRRLRLFAKASQKRK
jgi:exopolysaccharide production protein ExoZ